MKRIAMLLGFLGFFSAVVGLAPASTAYAASPWYPSQLSFPNDCTNETVDATGMFTDECSGNSDSAGGNHQHRCVATFRGTAVGQSTGTGYVFNAAGPLDYWNSTIGASEERYFEFYVQMISLAPNMPDLRVILGGFHTVTDANGIQRVYFTVDKVTCK